MHFKIWTAEISAKLLVFFVFFYTVTNSQINLFLNLYFIYLYVIFKFFVFILKADESGE